MIPSCTIWAIRNSFLSENQKYTPFTESNDDEDRTCHFYNCYVFRNKEPLILWQTVKENPLKESYF